MFDGEAKLFSVYTKLEFLNLKLKRNDISLRCFREKEKITEWNNQRLLFIKRRFNINRKHVLLTLHRILAARMGFFL